MKVVFFTSMSKHSTTISFCLLKPVDMALELLQGHVRFQIKSEVPGFINLKENNNKRK